MKNAWSIYQDRRTDGDIHRIVSEYWSEHTILVNLGFSKVPEELDCVR